MLKTASLATAGLVMGASTVVNLFQGDFIVTVVQAAVTAVLINAASDD